MSGTAERITLRLYVAGETPKCIAAFENLKRVCDEHLHGEYEIEIIDLKKNPQLARADQIVAIPAVVRTAPSPRRTMVGDFSDARRVLECLDIRR